MSVLFPVAWIAGFTIALILTVFILTRDEKNLDEESEELINNKNKEI